ncbi:DUF808 domain-containing protein [Deinococcus sp. SL84]|uniref:DUF808 domain-containing protein n=1 Tax=Deinococcus sp. SL84 TaxID=2994663 RepID=UPI002274BDDD|nr:DUF808 domain-containing protein [Deinococcus sp. SL84]MCY1703375.1 DUF808 domain-containing protein [Deinococcus sp. SL84]
MSGLIALLDDVAAIAKAAAASIDDVGVAASRASAKAVGVVVDDTAVTPRYVTGFTPDRELPVIWKIAKGSLRNKIVFILPAVLLLSQFLPQSLSPLLMLGGAYLSYEGAEKVFGALRGTAEDAEEDQALSGAEQEAQMVAGAIRTDFILSAEIMVIALVEVAAQPLLTRALSLVVVALAITALVYGVVAAIVKMDDLGLQLSHRRLGSTRALGRLLVRAMPAVMSVLSVVGTAAMLWVGGHILLTRLAEFGITAPEHWAGELSHRAAAAVPFAAGAAAWLAETLVSAAGGLLVGLVLVGVLHLLPRRHTAG